MAKKKIKTFLPTLDRNLLTERIMNFLMEHRGESFPKKKIMRLLKITNHPGKMMAVDIIDNLIEEKKLSQNSDGDIAYNPQSQIEEGTYVRRNHGKGYVELADGTLVRIYDEDAHHAIHGDKVKVCIFAKRRGGSKVLGEVTEILEHDSKPIVGLIQKHGDVAFMQNYSGLFPYDVLIPKDKQKGCKDGDKVTVRILSWPDNTRNPVGEVIDVLGKSGDNNTEMHAILAEFGLPYSYPEAVEKEADKLDPGITPEEIAKREDFRNVTTFTIDPKDAKDFDDALSIRQLDNGLWEVGVHIADVSHYVTPNSIIDRPRGCATSSALCVPMRKNSPSLSSSTWTRMPISNVPVSCTPSSRAADASPTKKSRTSSSRTGRHPTSPALCLWTRTNEEANWQTNSSHSTEWRTDSGKDVSRQVPSTSTARRPSSTSTRMASH